MANSSFLLKLLPIVVVLFQLWLTAANSSPDERDSSGELEAPTKRPAIWRPPKLGKMHSGCWFIGHSQRIVCTCNSHQCEQLDFKWPETIGDALLVRSSKSGARFEVSPLHVHNIELSRGPGVRKLELPSHDININMTSRHQRIMGFGGAFTDAALINMESLSQDLATKLLESYYGPNGLRYNFARVPIGGSDFSARNYTYDDTDKPDLELKSWALQPEDVHYKIPYLKMAAELTEQTGQDLKVFASPWSPPSWMKTSKSLVRGKLIDEDAIYKSYAEYLMKFYEAYEEAGVKFWGATVQNEPKASFLPVYFFNSLQFGNKQMAKFISKYYGPALEARGKTKENFKLMVGDDSLGFINLQVPQILADPEVARYVSGLAFHWYTSGSVVPYDSLLKCIDQVKDKIEFVMMSEACTGYMPGSSGVDFGSWTRGEQYAKDIMEDLSRGTGSWVDWNLALDSKGGPNWAKNYVDAPIIVNKDKNEFYKQPMYYVLGHFSRFMRPDSQRLLTSVQSKQTASSVLGKQDLMAVSSINDETGHLTINILNQNNQPQQINFNLLFPDGEDKYQLPSILLEGRSISTVVLKM